MVKFFAQRNNPTFWVTSVSQLLLAIQIILAIFGQQALLTQVLENKILDVVEAIITVLGTIGVFKNPITPIVPDQPVVTPVVDPTPAPVEPVAPVQPAVEPTEPVSPVGEPSKVPPIQGPVVVTEPVK